MLGLYTLITGQSRFFLKALLKKRCKKGKEDPDRLDERMGIPSTERPEGRLLWFHAASVGEAQSCLILMDSILKIQPDSNILITTGTVTSAKLMEKRLPKNAVHQYYPLDHPLWVQNFVSHWQPDLVIWMESELWPNMLSCLQNNDIPCALINARMSERSFRRWKKAKKSAKKLLNSFKVIVTQTQDAADYFKALGAENVHVGGNLKYSASPLPYDQNELRRLQTDIGNRPIWLYSSTHDGEEDIACRIQGHLSKSIPDLLTIIVPRHPERRDQIRKTLEKYNLPFTFRGSTLHLPKKEDQVYVVDTLGELGLFYRLSEIACIGRSLSTDGGGGHNPIEAAQLDCAILFGPHIQNQKALYADFHDTGSALKVNNEAELQSRIERLLQDPDGATALQNKAASLVQKKAKIIDNILTLLNPYLLGNENPSPSTEP